MNIWGNYYEVLLKGHEVIKLEKNSFEIINFFAEFLPKGREDNSALVIDNPS